MWWWIIGETGRRCEQYKNIPIWIFFSCRFDGARLSGIQMLLSSKEFTHLAIVDTYRAFKRTRWSSKQEVSWKNIFLPWPGRFSAAITSSRNSTVWAASDSALFLCRKHFFAFSVPLNDQMLIATIINSMMTVNDRSNRNRKFCRKKYFERLVRRNMFVGNSGTEVLQLVPSGVMRYANQ